MPECCQPFLEQTNPLRPFKLRHAQQQASIVGNLLRFGLVEVWTRLVEFPGHCRDTGCTEFAMPRTHVHGQEGDVPACVEFGAGTGYLTSMLADGLAAQHLVMVDSHTFRLKADRWVSLKFGFVCPSMSYARLAVHRRPALMQVTEAGWLPLPAHSCGHQRLSAAGAGMVAGRHALDGCRKTSLWSCNRFHSTLLHQQPHAQVTRA